MKDLIAAADEELRNHVPGASKPYRWWGEASSREAELRWQAAYAEVLARAKANETFIPLEMPEGRCPPNGEMLLAWAMHRSDAALAMFPECATVEGDTVRLGATGDSECVTVYRGPLSLRGTVRLTGTVVVVGDFTVDGHLIDGWSSESALVVIGHERVKVFSACGDHIVSGDLDAEILHIDSEATTIAHGGHVRARAMVAEYWSADADLPFVVKPGALQPLLERLTPKPPDDLGELLKRYARDELTWLE